MENIIKLLDSIVSHPNMFLIGSILFIVLLSLSFNFFSKKNKKVIKSNDSEPDGVGCHFDPRGRMARGERDFYRSMSGGMGVDDNDSERESRRG